MTTRWVTIIGSRSWCNQWARFYAARAKRLCEQGDERGCWEALLMSAFWRTNEPWA